MLLDDFMARLAQACVQYNLSEECSAGLFSIMDVFAQKTGRAYKLYDYYGAEDAEQLIVLMGSGVETAAETAQWLNAHTGTKYGVLAVRLFRPFSAHDFAAAIPAAATVPLRCCRLTVDGQPQLDLLRSLGARL